MSFSWTWYFPTGQSWFFCFFTAVLYTTTPIRFLVIDGSRILLVVIFITAITQSSSPRHKKEICTSCFLCACIYCSHGTKSCYCVRRTKSAEIPAVDLRAARVQGHFRPKSFAWCCCVIYPPLRSRLTIFPPCGFQSGWLQLLLLKYRNALAYLMHPLVLISFSNCGSSSWNIYLDIQAFLDQNLCSISHVKLYWDIWTRHHRSCWRQNNSD